MKQKSEEIYHRFVNYEWNDVGDALKKSIIEAIETALKEGQKLPIQNVSNNEVAVCDHVWIKGRVTVGTEVCIKCNEARLKQTDC